ncbi:TonB family protein [Herbaspirillum sp. SJZ107]|uniref:TonB family protein n=1 Tax=Herbaspirillum sp. SJZ107 TaxID=2572881 RepID=UPI00114F5DE4|nr:TonB family protein [Herbaspirillum sp. SJZ107]TQK11909.1 TonB family protein [Herbaspirillum sp. SJZ107]
MTYPIRSLLLAAVLACAPFHAGAAGCAKPAYPRESLRNAEEGITLLGFLIRTDGSVGDTVVLNASGHPALDTAARDALSKCVFKPARRNGEPVEQWVPVAYKWWIDGDQGMNRAKRDALTLAEAGDAGALYHLSLLYAATAQTDADREAALAGLRSAAEQGQAHAMFELARRYEKGEGMPPDAGEALRWYRQSADKGDVLAIQHLKNSARAH